MKDVSFHSILLLAFIAVALPTVSAAQSRDERKGDKLMDAFAYHDATYAYLKAIQTGAGNDGILLKLATCYRLLNNAQGTVRWYREVINNDQLISPEDKLYYAMALMEIGYLDEARNWFSIYSTQALNDERPKKYLARLDDLESLKLDSSLYRLKPAGFNSAYSDFSPAFFNNQIVFVSARNMTGETYKWDRSSFLDLYVSTRNSLGIYSQGVPFAQNINTKYHEGPLQFFDSWKRLVLTRNNYEDGKLMKGSSGVTRLKLYFYRLNTEGRWMADHSFPYNSDDYSVGHPAISEDGHTLYFVSDMPGGFGGTDIYVSYFESPRWTSPKNLGTSVNTKGDEMFPFLQGKDILYFASNGHGGLGGLDIYKYDGKLKTLKNMGIPINSSRDDFGFIIDQNTKEGFFASNRGSAYGDDNIYQFKILQPEIYLIKAIILDATTKWPIDRAYITIKEFGSSDHNSSTSDTGGLAELSLKLRHQYQIIVQKDGYLESASYITPQNGNEELTIELLKTD